MELRDHADNQGQSAKEVPFFPNVLLAEVSLAIAVIGLLAIFVSLFPLKLGEKFDPLNPPTILEPEWYFMGVYQFLKTQSVQPFHGILLLVALGIFLVMVPFVDRGSERRPFRRPFFTAFALFAIVEFLALTVYGYMSPGQVGSFSDSGFVAVLAVTNLVALCFIASVLAVNRQITRRERT